MEFIAEIPRIIKEILYALIEISLNTCRNIVYFMELFSNFQDPITNSQIVAYT